MTAVPPLTEAEARTVARFESAPHDEASAVARVGLAIHDALCDCLDRGHGLTLRSRDTDVAAHAALSAMKGPDASHVTEAMERLAEELDDESGEYEGRLAYQDAADRIRAALADTHGGQS